MRARESRPPTLLPPLAALLLAAACGPQDAVQGAPSAEHRDQPPPLAPTPDDVVLPRSAPDPATAAQAAERAATLEARRQWPEALAAWDEAWLAGGGDEVALSYATALLGNHLQVDPPRARAVLRTSFGPDPKDPRVRILQARAAFRMEDLAACATFLDALDRLATESSELSPNVRAEASFLRGSIAEREGDFDRAAAAYTQAVQLVPSHAAFLCRLGVAEHERGHGDAALESLRAALALQPDLLEAHYRLSLVLRDRGDAEAAEREKEIHRQLNRLTDNQAKTEAAYRERFAALQVLAVLLPEYRQGRALLAEYHLMLGDAVSAELVANALLHEDPSQVAALPTLVGALRRTLGDAGARDRLAVLLTEIPSLPPAQREQVRAIVQNGFPR